MNAKNEYEPIVSLFDEFAIIKPAIENKHCIKIKKITVVFTFLEKIFHLFL